MPTGKGLAHALTSGKAIGCTAVQVFTSSPQQWKAKTLGSEGVAAFRAAVAETGIEALISHDSYLVNLCAVTPEIAEKSVVALKGELDRCATLGIPLVVSHMGAHMGQGEEEGLRRVAEAALEVLAETDPSTTLLMETTAGQGTCLNHRFEQLARVLELAGAHPRLGVCLDTCHVHSAGYDLSTDEGYDATMADFARRIGFDRLRAVHANDSKHPAGSRKDRHEHLGQGSLGELPFRRLVQDPRFDAIPIVVETPEADSGGHEANVGRLWSWATG